MKWQLKLYVTISLIFFCFFIYTFCSFAKTYPKGDGKISLYSYHTNDVLEITFRNKNGYDKDALKKIYYLMRSRGDDKPYPISTKLVDLLDHIQDHFEVDTIEIISGYRSTAFNEFLIESGRGAASESLHTKGMAADIHIDEITEYDLWKYIQSLNVGGVGYYPRFNFVHVDVGPTKRNWREPDAEERILTGVDLSPNKGWSVISDKNIYQKGEPIKFEIRNEMLKKSPLVKNFWYERFIKGKWREHKIIMKSKEVTRLATGQSYSYTWKPVDLPYGKYRMVVFASRDFNIPPAYSNEFYIKKQREKRDERDRRER